MPTKTTRGPNAKEKRYVKWIKEEKLTCDCCKRMAPLIGHHCEGATFKHNKVLVGHWFVLGLCERCDEVVTLGSRRSFREHFRPQAEIWLEAIQDYQLVNGFEVPEEVIESIRDWGR